MAMGQQQSSADTGLNHTTALDQFPHVPFVSRRFREDCRDPGLWTELHVRSSFSQEPGEGFSPKARWKSFLRWLAARGSNRW